MRRKAFYVDVMICDDEELPAERDLERFCEMLQEEIPDVQVVSATVSRKGTKNLALSLVIDHVLNETLAEYSDHSRIPAGRRAVRERSSFLVLFVLAHAFPSPPPGFDLSRN
jgi:hypothetical protein